MAPADAKLRMFCGWVAAALAALAVLVLDVGAAADWALYDSLQRLLPTLSPKVAIVELDPDTFETLGWPLQKDLYAGVVGALHDARATAVGADLFFTQRDPRAEEGEEQLLGTEAQRAGAVFATYVVQGVAPEGGVLPSTPAASRVACPEVRAGAYARPLVPGLVGKAEVGHVHSSPDADGVFRRISACEPLHDGCIRDLASKLTGRTLDPATCAASELVPFLRAFEDFPRLSFGRAIELLGSPEGKAELEGFASGRVVLLGLTDPTLGDFGPTPRKKIEPLVTVHANRVEALLAGVRITPVAAPVLVIFSLLMLGVVLWRIERARWLLGASAVLTALTVAASALAFQLQRLWIPPAPLLLPALTGCVGAALYAGWKNLRFNTVLNEAFGMYVAPEVLSWLKETGGAALDPAAAETREVTVLFSDISGYTSLSNRLPAAKVMQSLRFYLDEMVAIVTRHGGYVDKINGDGLVVLFGAPKTEPAHARSGFACATEMQARVVTANARWKELTGSDLKIRIGVATGLAFTGNLGGQGHFEYSAIGTVVNLAARLESKSEVGGILLSEGCWAALTEKPRGGWRDVELKGYEAQDPVRAWQVPPVG